MTEDILGGICCDVSFLHWHLLIINSGRNDVLKTEVLVQMKHMDGLIVYEAGQSLPEVDVHSEKDAQLFDVNLDRGLNVAVVRTGIAHQPDGSVTRHLEVLEVRCQFDPFVGHAELELVLSGDRQYHLAAQALVLFCQVAYSPDVRHVKADVGRSVSDGRGLPDLGLPTLSWYQGHRKVVNGAHSVLA